MFILQLYNQAWIFTICKIHIAFASAHKEFKKNDNSKISISIDKEYKFICPFALNILKMSWFILKLAILKNIRTIKNVIV